MTIRLTVKEFACGYLEVYDDAPGREAPRVTIEMEHGVYHIKRSPWHPAGHAWESAHTVAKARGIARRLRKEQPVA